MTYSIDFRRKVFSIKEKEGLSYNQTAERFGIGKTSLVRWRKQLEPKRNRNKPATKINMEALKIDITKYPDSYHYERSRRLGVGIRTVGDALKRLKVTYKKSLIHPKAKEEERRCFQGKISKYKEEGKPLVYLDESGFANSMPRTHGYALRGERCYGKHDWWARGRTNAIGALLGKELLTVSLFEHNIDTQTFTSWIKQDLIPKLPKDSVIVLDNATFAVVEILSYI